MKATIYPQNAIKLQEKLRMSKINLFFDTIAYSYRCVTKIFGSFVKKRTSNVIPRRERIRVRGCGFTYELLSNSPVASNYYY